jgi:hypothetical protein
VFGNNHAAAVAERQSGEEVLIDNEQRKEVLKIT